MNSQEYKVKLLVPDLPCATELLPWLKRIDDARRYANDGPLIRELEGVLARNWPANSPQADGEIQVVALSSGTTSIDLAIQAKKLAPGSSVLMPAFTFPATALAVLRNQLVPVLADVGADSWQLSPATARMIAASRPLAMVLPVATFGSPVDVAAWDEFVEETGIPVHIDAAAGFGHQAVGRRASLSFSMHATKPFGIGEGGLFVTRNAAFATQVRRLANFGFEDSKIVHAGTNGKLSEYAAAIGLAQWQRWPVLQTARERLWQRYLDFLTALPGVSIQNGFLFSPFKKGAAIPASLALCLPQPAAGVLQRLHEQGIESRRLYYPALNQHPAFSRCAVAATGDGTMLPVTTSLGETCLGIPWHTRLTEQDMALVCGCLKACLHEAEDILSSAV